MAINGGNHAGGPETFSAGDSFKFDCHGGLSCFGQCCRDINIFLTPYDVLRLRRKLGITTAAFLNKHTGELDLPQAKFPFIYLKMNEEDQLKCPFVTERGCAVYEERPWSCRMAPVDIAGPGKYRFAFDREKCLGLKESREWNVREWMHAQQMEIYDEVEKSFKEIPFLIRSTGQEGLDRRIAQLFRLVCYDTDTFKDFVMRNRFLIREGGIDPEAFKRSLKDDVQLLQLGVRWLINVACNVKTLKKIDKVLKERD